MAWAVGVEVVEGEASSEQRSRFVEGGRWRGEGETTDSSLWWLWHAGPTWRVRFSCGRSVWHVGPAGEAWTPVKLPSWHAPAYGFLVSVSWNRICRTEVVAEIETWKIRNFMLYWYLNEFEPHKIGTCLNELKPKFKKHSWTLGKKNEGLGAPNAELHAASLLSNMSYTTFLVFQMDRSKVQSWASRSVDVHR